jgi:hypothetical protein
MIEPPVSVPTAKPTRPAAVAAAGPADDPLEPRDVSHGFFVLPPNQTSPIASSPVVSLQDGARLAHALDGGGVDRRHVILVGVGAPRGADVPGREQILDAVRDAVERPLVTAGANLSIRRGRLRAREILGQRHHALQRVAVPLQAGEIQLGQLGRGNQPRLDERGERRQRQERDLIVGRACREARAIDVQRGVRRRASRPRRAARRADRRARVGFERESRLDVVVDRNPAQRVVVLPVDADVRRHQIVLGVGEDHARDLLGAAQGILGKGVGRRGGRQPARGDPGRERGGHGLEERAT